MSKKNEIVTLLFTAYIDDLCLICEDGDSLKEVYDDLVEFLRFIGLELNHSKSAIMTINTENKITEIKETNKCIYLGELISSDGTYTESLSLFIKRIYSSMITLDKRTKIDNIEKIKIFNKCILPIIQRKILVIFDLTVQDKVKIANIIKNFLTKWDYQRHLIIFTKGGEIFDNTDDEVIKYLPPAKDCNEYVNCDDDDMDEINIVDKYINIQEISFNYENMKDEINIDNIIDACSNHL
jgi:hypothetical protein